MFDVQRDYLTARRLDLAAEATRFEGLLAADGAAALAAFREARERCDLAGVLAGGKALFERDLLPDDELVSYAEALVAEGRTAEAIPVWGKAVAADPQAAGPRYALALAFAETRAFAKAGREAAEAARLKPNLIRASNIARRAKLIARMQDEPPSWRRLQVLVAAQRMIGAPAAAAALLDSLRDGPPPGEPTREEAESLVEAGLDLGRAKVVKPLIARLAAEPDRDDRIKTLLLRMAEALGSPDAVKAKAWLPPLSADAGLPAKAQADRRRLRYHAAEAMAAAGDLHEATRQLGALVTSDRRDFAALTALQRVSGEAVLTQLGGMVWADPRPPKIFNLLPFYNERTLLEMRLAEMGDWVDHFVIVEAGRTFTGVKKPLNFRDLSAAYADRGDQMIGVTIKRFPEWCDTAWARDFHQRDMAVAGLIGRLRPDDIVLITDADEIVDRRALDGFWPHLASLRMATSKHFVNYCALPGNSHANRRSGAICRGEHLATWGSTYIRTGLSAARKRWETVPAAGWHFTSLGEAEAVVQKLNAYAHQEEGKTEHRSLDSMREELARVRHGVFEPGWAAKPLDKRFPRFVRDNRAMFEGLILDA